MNKEELIKNQFPNDEFLQSAVSQIVDKCTADLEQEYASLKGLRKYELNVAKLEIEKLEKENAELKPIAEFQQSSNMNTHFEIKKLKEGLAVGSTLNKGLNSRNKYLEEERDKYRNMVFDKDEQLTKAKEIIEELYNIIPASMADYAKEPMEHARKFLTEEVDE